MINYDAAIAELLRRLPPIQVEAYDASGRLIDREAYPFPGPIRLRYGRTAN